MESQQIVDYISQQLKAGHSEAVLRKHLRTHNWSQAAVDTAFKRYRRSLRTGKAHKSQRLRRGGRPVAARWSRKRLGRLVAVLIVLGALGFGAYKLYWPGAQTPPIKPVTRQLSFKERQTIDVTLVGGAIAQYTSANGGVLPTKLSVSPDGSLVMCNASCDPTTSAIATLTIYQANNVKLVPYSTGLTAPDKDTMFLVAAAKCNSDRSMLSGVNSNPRSMVLLYAQFDGTKLTHRCVSL